MKTFTLYWRSGTVQTVQGDDDILNVIGRTGRSLGDLDYYEGPTDSRDADDQRNQILAAEREVIRCAKEWIRPQDSASALDELNGALMVAVRALLALEAE
jgi:hypothetical protein